MEYQFGCEIVVFQVLPAVKAKLARTLKEQGVRQSRIAQALNTTEAGVSQYLSGKRAASITIPDELNPMFNAVAEIILHNESKEVLNYGLAQICREVLRRDYKDQLKNAPHSLCNFNQETADS